jgi:hypothetical protein
MRCGKMPSLSRSSLCWQPARCGQNCGSACTPRAPRHMFHPQVTAIVSVPLTQVIQQSQARPTYQQLAASGNPISANLPKATVRVPQHVLSSPTAAGVLSSLTRASAAASSSTLRSTQHSTHSTNADGGDEAVPPLPTELDAAALRQEVDGVIANVAAHERECHDASLTAAAAAELASKLETEIRCVLRDCVRLCVCGGGGSSFCGPSFVLLKFGSCCKQQTVTN